MRHWVIRIRKGDNLRKLLMVPILIMFLSVNIGTAQATYQESFHDLGPTCVIQTSFSVIVPMNASVLDDGLPTGFTLVTEWTQIIGPVQAVIADPFQIDTNITFTEIGMYVFRLTANDGELQSFDDVTVDILSPANQAPCVNAGVDQSLLLMIIALLVELVGG